MRSGFCSCGVTTGLVVTSILGLLAEGLEVSLSTPITKSRARTSPPATPASISNVLDLSTVARAPPAGLEFDAAILAHAFSGNTIGGPGTYGTGACRGHRGRGRWRW